MSEERKEGEGDDTFVTVKVSEGLLKILSEDWSVPVQIRILPPIGDTPHHEMIARRADAAYLFEDRRPL